MTGQGNKGLLLVLLGVGLGIILGVLLVTFLVSPLELPVLGDVLVSKELPKGFHRTDGMDIIVGAVRGSITMGESPHAVLADLRLASKLRIDIKLEFDGKLLRFDALKSAQQTKSSLEMEQNYLQLTHIGENRYLLLFELRRAGPTPIIFKITSVGNLIYQSSVLVGRP
jgi:hypothetical protein